MSKLLKDQQEAHAKRMEEAASESYVQDMIQANAFGVGCTLMRNNSGAFKDETGRVVRFGLGNQSKAHSEKMKSSDLIGFTRVTITPDMVGKTIAVFTAVEVKDPKWNYKESDKRAVAQGNFITWIRANGGFAGFARSWAEFCGILGR